VVRQEVDENRHWSEDKYWTEALDEYERLRNEGRTTITLDLAAIEKVAYRGDGPAYRLMQAVVSVHELEGEEGFRGAPRVMLASLVRLAELSRTLKAEGSR
jgi:hypothetical protein